MTEPSPAPIRVLVVDDEPALLDAYRQILVTPEAPSAQDARRSLGAKLFGQAESTPARPARPPTVFEPHFCNNAQAAVDAVAAALEADRPFAVAFLDMRMAPGPDGVWAAARIRELDPAIEIVICTAYSDVDPGDLGTHVPPEEKLSYLQKPFHPHEVRQMTIALASKWRGERHIARLAYFDALTGLPNRDQTERHLRSALESAKAASRLLALMFIDLDKFKRVNDMLGHDVGDEVLKVTSDRLRSALRQTDSVGRDPATGVRTGNVGRLGGDEFIVILPDLGSSEDAAGVADRLVTALEQPMRLSQNTVVLTPSIGIAVAPADGTDAETLLRHADLAMYSAKRRSPGGWAFFDVSMNEGVLQRYAIESRLRGALERSELSLHYQPQIDTATGNLAGMEALLRWNSPELGAVPPAEFVPIAEDAGLIIPIGEWVLRVACTQAKQWADEGLAFKRIAVNIAAQQFAMRNFTTLLASILAETGLPAGMLELEITESMVMRDETWASRVLKDLHQIGVSVAIDDFGTGYSNYQRLQHLEIDRLKIDRSFVVGIGEESDDRAIATAMISMAKSLKLDIVAEGVESFEQLRFLQDQACGHAQGFLISRALPAGEARLILQRATEQFDGTRTQRLKRLTT